MAWFDKHRRSRQRADQAREALAASVEEITAQDELSGEDWDEEDGAAGRTAIIPPVLSLQSRPLPVVRVDVAKHVRVEREPILPESRPHTEARMPAQAKRLGRSTRVRLQAVRPEQGQERITERVSTLEATANVAREDPAQAVTAVDRQKQIAEQREPIEAWSAAQAGSQPLGGSGIIEQGQEEVTVVSAQVSAQSVVVVMLAGDPGPVVVQYVSLHPSTGFTCHLSAPVAAPTPFNYLVLSR